MIEKTTRLVLLYDFYKDLLTYKQRNIFELFFHDDLSYGEISDELNVSRQAVNDTIRRTEATLLDYEEKLGLVEKHQARADAIMRWQEALGDMTPDTQRIVATMIDELMRIEN